MDNSRKVKTKRWDSLQYLKYAIHNSWSLRPKIKPKETIIENTTVVEYKANPVTKFKATTAKGNIFYYSVQDTVFDDDSDEEDDDDEVIDHVSFSNQVSNAQTPSEQPQSFDEFASELDLNNVSALNPSNQTTDLDELIQVLESQSFTLTPTELPKINLEDFQDNNGSQVFGVYEDLSKRNSELLNVQTAETIVLQKSVESNQEYLTFSINNPLDSDSAKIQNNSAVAENVLNSKTEEYVTLDLTDISNNVILQTDLTNHTNNDLQITTTRDVLLTENVQYADINEFLDSAAQCSAHNWSTLEEFLQDFNALTIEENLQS